MKNTEQKTARAAVLVQPKEIEVREFPIPTLRTGEILVKVEGCGICGTDVHEYKRDPFGLVPVVLGHEGTGTILATGGDVKDFTGRLLEPGDQIVTSILVPDDCAFTHDFPAKSNLSDNLGVYGLLPDSEEYHLNGFFATHIIIRPGSTVFTVNGMSLKERLLIEPVAVTAHALERAKTTGLLNFASSVIVQGCGPIGLLMIATLYANGNSNIIAIDSVPQRLEMAKKMGAAETIQVDPKNPNEVMEKVCSLTRNRGVDFAFQCTGVPAAAAAIWKFIRRGGGLCEVGFFMDNGTCTINPHEDLCKKEVTAVGSWVYTAEEYPVAIAMIRHLTRIGIPLESLVTHTFPLDRMSEAMETNIAMQGIKLAIIPN
ncbi:MAG: zinc-binding dehydrogenase [Chthoniobacterales bacterium]